MYSNATVCARTTNGFSHEIPVRKVGVHQGNTLSPTLFYIFTNDIPGDMTGCDSPHIDKEIPISYILYAGDIVLLTTTKTGLQGKLNQLHEYCKQWGMRINRDKTKILFLPELIQKYLYSSHPAVGSCGRRN